MAEPVVLYKKPNNAEAFDKHFSSVHIPLARKSTGLKKKNMTSARAPSGLLPGLPGIAQGQAAARDLANFADGGAELYFFDTKEV